MSEQLLAWASYLRKTRLFSTLTNEELTAIAKRLSLISLPKGAMLFKKGDPGDAFYIIHSGRLQIVSDPKPATDPNGRQEKVVAYLGRGESLGEMALLAEETRTISARADTTSELLCLSKTEFEKLLQKKPTIGVHLSRVLSSRLATAAQTVPVKNHAEIHVIIGTLGFEDEIIFISNLALSLVQQTRRRIALLEIADEPGNVARALGLPAIRTAESLLNREDLHNPYVAQHLGTTHPSGLEVIAFPTQIFRGELGDSLPILLSTLKDTFDHVLIRLPAPGDYVPASHAHPESLRVDEITGSYSSFVQPLLEEADRILLVSCPDSRNVDQLGTTLVSALSNPQKIRRVWIETDGVLPPVDFRAHFRIPWRADFASEFKNKSTPYVFGSAPMSQRMTDRLARFLGHLRIGIAMGSGAAFGYTLIGILKVLEREGIYPDVISGTSMGALIGAFYTAGKNPQELEEIALSITKGKLWSMRDLTLPRSGLLIGRKLLMFLKSVIGDVTFDQLMTPFACVATDIRNGQEIVIKQGVVAEAVRASLSLPFFFQPYYLEGRYLVDGGLVNPVPTSVIVNLGADILISVNLTSKPSEKHIPRLLGWHHSLPIDLKGPDLREILIKTIYTMQHEIAVWRSEVAHAVLTPDVSDFTWAEFYKAAEIIKVGEACAEEYLPKIKGLLPFYADACKTSLPNAAKNNF